MLALFLAVINSPEDRFLFETVYYEYRGLMLNIAKGMLHDHHLAEDAVSESFGALLNPLIKYSRVLRTR